MREATKCVISYPLPPEFSYSWIEDSRTFRAYVPDLTVEISLRPGGGKYSLKAFIKQGVVQGQDALDALGEDLVGLFMARLLFLQRLKEVGDFWWQQGAMVSLQ
jgi:hypothetical protein